jgi:hypothetical protein
VISITRFVSIRTRQTIPYLLAVAGLAGTINAEARVSISGSPATKDVVGTPYKFTPSATSTHRHSTLRFAISNKPAWSSFDGTTGTLSGTPNSRSVGTSSNIKIAVNDGRSWAVLTPFAITVTGAASTPPPTTPPPTTPPTTPPPPTTGNATISWTPPTTNSDGSALTGLAGYKIDYGNSATSLTKSVQVASAGAHSYTVSNLAAGKWYFAVQAYTNSGTQSGMSNVASKTIQ